MAGKKTTTTKWNGDEIVRWVADQNARRVPTFVIVATKLDTKKKIVARYGLGAVFEKGGRLPPVVKARKVTRKAA